MPGLSERRIDAWTALAADPAVRAAERAIVTGSPAVLADTLTVSATAEARRRLARVLELKDRAERDPGGREAYQRAADELRGWAAGVYLAAVRGPAARGSPPGAPLEDGSRPTEEAVSIRRAIQRPPFPGQPKRHPRDASAPPGPARRAQTGTGSAVSARGSTSACTAPGTP